MSILSKLILVLLILQCRALPQDLDNTEKSILEVQDSRNANKIRGMYNNGQLSEDKYLKKALTALANIADTNYDNVDLIMKIYSLMEEKYNRAGNIDIQSEACFALGQIQCNSSLDFLRMIEEKEMNEYSAGRIKIVFNVLNALGKIGRESDLERICSYEFENDSLRGAIALSIARFGMRKIKSISASDKLRKLANYIEDERQRKWVAYAFSRIGDKEMLATSRTELEFLSVSSDVFCKMWAYSALGKTGDANYADFIMKRYPLESDWRVKVNMLNAIGNLDINEGSMNEENFNIIMHYIDEANPNVSLTACQLLAKICGKLDKTHQLSLKLREYFEHYLVPGRAIDYYIQNEMITTLAKIFKDDYRSSLFSLFSQSEGYDRKSAIVSSFQYMNDPMVYKELRDSISADVQRYNKTHPNKDGSMIGSMDLAKIYRAFVEVLSVLDNKMDDKNKNTIRLIYSEFSASKNPAITDICLSKLSDSMYSKYWEETGQIMIFDFGSLDEKKDKDIMLLYIDAWGKMKSTAAEEILEKELKSTDYDLARAAADALKLFTGNDYLKSITAERIKNDFDWSYIGRLEYKKIAEVNTEKGKIKIQLFPEIAPFTVQSFVKLGETGFYNGTVFHRVVPNFVIQGGDPTGTGYGGPGYSIRTEIADIGFDSYYIGMASSGKDTEGSQFFITHSPQPHLDGKYTVFGKVIDGYDAVEQIVIGDKINNITFSSN